MLRSLACLPAFLTYDVWVSPIACRLRGWGVQIRGRLRLLLLRLLLVLVLLLEHDRKHYCVRASVSASSHSNPLLARSLLGSLMAGYQITQWRPLYERKCLR